MVKELKHIREYTSRVHCGCEILPTDTFVIPYLEVAKITELEADGFMHTHDKIELHFKPNPYTNLPMLLNTTNLGILSKWFSSKKLTNDPSDKRELQDYPVAWLDSGETLAVRLYREKRKNPKGGGQVWGLSIHKDRPKPPADATPKSKAKEVITESHEKFNDCKKHVAEGTYTVEQLRAWFDISAEVEELLTKVEG